MNLFVSTERNEINTPNVGSIFVGVGGQTVEVHPRLVDDDDDGEVRKTTTTRSQPSER